MTDSRQHTLSGSNPVLKEYARLAPQYDQRWSFYVRETSRETIDRLCIRPMDSVLDIGCGTGALLYQLSNSYAQAGFEGIDPCPEMLAIARDRLPGTIALQQGWAEQIPHANNTFDLVVSCNAFHYMRQPVVALQEMLRVLRPEGRLVITDWCDDYITCRVFDWYFRRVNSAHFRTYRAHQCKSLLEEAGATDIIIERYRIDWLWGLMTATARKRASCEEESTEASRHSTP
jgi:ubiquinone/menaquinone biosynthesis C-methylase UbiE